MRDLLDAIYWRLHRAYLLNNREEAFKFMDMLEASMKSVSDLESEIGSIQVERFKTMKNNMFMGELTRLHGSGSTGNQPFIPYVKEESSLAEKAFCKLLLSQGRSILLDTIGCSAKAVISTEHEMGDYGRLDFFVRENRVCKIVEVKMGCAPTGLTSQIDKYRVGSELDMCLGIYDQVDAYAIAESYPSYVISELTRSGVVVLTHCGTPESLKRIA